MSNFMSYETPVASEAHEVDQAAARNEEHRKPGVVTIQADGNGNITATRQVVTNHSGKDFAGDAAGSVLASARTKMGMPILSSEVKDSTLVTVSGVEMTALDAARLGYLERFGVDDYSESEQYEAKAAEAKSQQPPEIQITGDLLSPASRNEVNQIASQFGHSVIRNGLLSAAAAMVSGDKNKGKAAVESFSSQISQEPAKGEAILSGVLTDLLSRISGTASYILKQGGEPAEAENVVEFLRHCNKEVKSNLIVRGLSGDNSVVKDVVARYKQSRRN